MELIYCLKCEQIEARQNAVRQLRQLIFADGELSYAKDPALSLRESLIVAELKDHQALEHKPDKRYEGQLPPQ